MVSQLTHRQKLQDLAEWIFGSLILIFGLSFLDSILALLLPELYRLLLR